MSQNSQPIGAKTWHDDASLLGMWRNGNLDARDTLIRRYDHIARRRLASRVRSEQDLDDLVQRLLLRFTQALANYQGNGKIRSFYVAVEGYVMLDYYRGCYREPENFDPDQLTMEDLDDISPCRRLCLSRHLARLAEALETVLTLNERTVIEQLFIDRLSVAAVAEGMNVAESTVRGLLMRARQKLRDHFGDDYMEIARGVDVSFDELAQQLAMLGAAMGY
jgi:RNA polymerase sigma factor (sigma-70 family)